MSKLAGQWGSNTKFVQYLIGLMCLDFQWGSDKTAAIFVQFLNDSVHLKPNLAILDHFYINSIFIFV